MKIRIYKTIKLKPDLRKKTFNKVRYIIIYIFKRQIVITL